MILTLLFTVLSGLITALVYSSATLSLWWVLPLWLGFYLAAGLLYIVVIFGVWLIMPQKDPTPRGRYICHRFIKLTLSWILSLLGMRITLTGAETLPQTPFLLVGNHRSAFDPLCTAAVLTKQDIVFVAKPGVMNLPLLGTILRHLHFLAIDRENARNAVTTIKRAAELMKDVGLSVGIYPEGTRNKGTDLLPFHAGSFKIAKLAACPVAVATVRYEKHGLLPWNKRVQIHIVDIMDTAFVAENNTAAMSERAEAAIRADMGL